MFDSSRHSSQQSGTTKTVSSQPPNLPPARPRKKPSARDLRRHIRNINHMRLTLLVAMLFTLLVATMFRTTPIIFMASLLFTAQFTATLAARFLGRGLAVSRALPEMGYAGDTVQGHIVVKNGARLPAFLVHVHPGNTTTEKTAPDTSTQDVSTQQAARGVAGHVPGAPLKIAGESELLLPILQPGENIEWQPRWKLQRRGVWEIPAAHIGVRDPLGLFTSATLRTEPQTMTILPRPVPLERVDFRGGESQTHTPQHASVAADAFDFHGIRPWQAGETIRRVHWKSTARTGQLHTVEWEEDFGSDLCVLLDMRATRKMPKNPQEQADDALEIIVTLAASVTAHLLNSGHAVRLFCWQNDENYEPQLAHFEGRSGRDLVDALQWMAKLQTLSPRAGKSGGQPSSADFLADAAQPYSLSQLAKTAATHLQNARGPGEAILILCCDNADYLSAAAELGRIVSQAETPTVIAVDAQSFIFQGKNNPRAPEKKARKTATPSSTQPNKARHKTQSHSDSRGTKVFSGAAHVRFLRHGQSLASVLEQ